MDTDVQMPGNTPLADFVHGEALPTHGTGILGGKSQASDYSPG